MSIKTALLLIKLKKQANNTARHVMLNKKTLMPLAAIRLNREGLNFADKLLSPAAGSRGFLRR